MAPELAAFLAALAERREPSLPASDDGLLARVAATFAELRQSEEKYRLVSEHVSVGIIVVHISNRYLDLEPVVAAIAKKHKYQTWSVHKTEEGGPTDTASDWVLVTKNEEFLNNPRVKMAGEPLRPAKELLWTDQFTALFPIMK